MRVLDLDLDFFVHGAAHWTAYDADRLDPKEYPPWSLEDAISFLENQCGLEGRRPGFAVEHHGELFGRWREAIAHGRLSVPFHVTHVDAHADLGLGDAAYVYLMTELLLEPPENRHHPNEGGPSGLADGNYLAFAVACQWISDIAYVYNEGGGDDIPRFLMENFDASAEHIELKAIAPDEVRSLIHGRAPEVLHREPLVPLRQIPYAAFRADEPFDMVCLARSPAYTPQASDPLYEEIRRRYIDEGAH